MVVTGVYRDSSGAEWLAILFWEEL